MTKELTEHEKLKWICDEIGYDYEFNNEKDIIEDGECTATILLDIREIIFTQEFMDKYANYLVSNYGFKRDENGDDVLCKGILLNLNSITDYLYNLLNKDIKEQGEDIK